jgi:hypothetical protein
MNHYPFEGPLGRIATPDFGSKHIAQLEREINALEPGQQPVIAVAHRSRWVSPNNWSQQSTLFLGISELSHVRLTVGQVEIWKGDAFPGLLWHFVNWDRARGPIQIQINDAVYTVKSVLQSTDMDCILFHPKPVVSQAKEAASPVAA